MDEIKELVERASAAVEADKVRKPVTGADGIWRFDRVIDEVFGKRDRDFYLQAEKVARADLVGAPNYGSWTGPDIVASFCQCKYAFMTPGFAEARSKYMS